MVLVLAMSALAAYCLFVSGPKRVSKVAYVPLAKLHVYSVADRVVVVSGWSGQWAQDDQEQNIADRQRSRTVRDVFGYSDEGDFLCDLFGVSKRAPWPEYVRAANEYDQRLRVEWLVDGFSGWRQPAWGPNACRTVTVSGSFAVIATRPFIAGTAALFGLFIPLAATARRWRLHRSRRIENRCLACGYPLRGLPECRCPECGTSFSL